jgi:methyl coenzyme M reductase gamma subunit
MPLLKGKENVGRNIQTEENAGKPRDQAIAIALSNARENVKKHTTIIRRKNDAKEGK